MPNAGRLRVSCLAIPSYAKMPASAVQAETLRRFELRFGDAPESFATLVPELMASVPINPMSGKALCYRLNGDGSYDLYSKGEDGRDDGGVGGMDLWSGPDALWPRVAGKE